MKTIIDLKNELADLEKNPKLELAACEFCLPDQACRMHYTEQLKANVGEKVYNEAINTNF